MRKVCAKMIPKKLTTEQKANRIGRSSGPPWEGARIIQSRYHRWWIMDFGVQPRDKTPKSGVAHCKLSPSQESENEQIQNQIDAHLFFWRSGDRPQGICATRINSIKLFIVKSLKDWGKGWHMYDQVLHALGCCTTTTPHVTRQSPSMNFFAEKSIPVVPQPPYLPDLSPCDFLLFPWLKNHLKGRHFGTLYNNQKCITNELKGTWVYQKVPRLSSTDRKQMALG